MKKKTIVRSPTSVILRHMLHLLILLAAFFPLIFGARLLVDGASSLAARLNVSQIVIGLTIVAFGTSAPELVVNLFASIEQNTSIALGNVLGSNIFNILGILGVAAVIYPLQVRSRTTWIEVPLCFLAAVVLLTMSSRRVLDGADIVHITRADGILLLLFFCIFLAYSFHSMAEAGVEGETTTAAKSRLISLIYVVAGLALLIAGGRVIVVSAVRLASDMGLSERVIALTIVSIGTSLPELATSAVAAYKKNTDIAIGNVVGSNIFNSFFILGISAVIHPLEVADSALFDLLVHTGAAALLFAFIFIGGGRRVDRREGILCIGLYAVYILFLLY